jgi:drug/metabolite transporter (DMT)-like permease
MVKQVKTYGPILILIAAFLWGVDGILRRSLYTMQPSVIVFYEHLIGALLIAPATFAVWRNQKVTKKDWGALFWIALLSGVIGTLMFTAALIKINYISMSVVFLLQKLQPIFAVTAAVILLKERINYRFVVWAILAFVAAYFVTFKNGSINFATGASTITAALLAVGAAFAWGSSTAVSRYAVLKLSSTLATGLRFFLTVPLAFITVLLFKDAHNLIQIDTSQIVRLIIIALTTGMVALWIYYKGLKSTEVKVATFLEFVFPLAAVLLDVIYFHNVLFWTQYLAAAVLLYTIYRLSQMNRAVIYSAEIIKGRGRGKGLGFPTFNLVIPKKFKEKHGIYAAKVWIDKRSYAGALHYGPIPTFHEIKPVLEVNILDYNDGKEIQNIDFEIIRYLRPVKSFSSQKALTAQIANDVAQIRHFLAS